MIEVGARLRTAVLTIWSGHVSSAVTVEIAELGLSSGEQACTMEMVHGSSHSEE